MHGRADVKHWYSVCVDGADVLGQGLGTFSAGLDVALLGMLPPVDIFMLGIKQQQVLVQ